MAKQSAYQSGASRIGAADDPMGVPTLQLRDYFALHAPAAPAFWKIRTPLDHAKWCWAWADAMLQTRELPTTPESSTTPGINRP